MKIEPTPGCIQSAMDIIGNKWTALLIRELTDDAKRFSQLEQAIPGLNPRTLSKRLSELETAGIILSCTDSGQATIHRCYKLTDKGRDLIPILRAMAKWGEKHPCKTTNPSWNVA